MDGMTIDEVIKYFDEDAEENAKLAIIYTGNDDDLAEMHKQDSVGWENVYAITYKYKRKKVKVRVPIHFRRVVQ